MEDNKPPTLQMDALHMWDGRSQYWTLWNNGTGCNDYMMVKTRFFLNEFCLTEETKSQDQRRPMSCDVGGIVMSRDLQ